MTLDGDYSTQAQHGITILHGNNQAVISFWDQTIENDEAYLSYLVTYIQVKDLFLQTKEKGKTLLSLFDKGSEFTPHLLLVFTKYIRFASGRW